MSEGQLFHLSILPFFHYSIIPVLHLSILPLFQYSIIPFLSAVPSFQFFHNSNIPLFQFLMRISTYPEIGISTNCLSIFGPVF